jgi:hypothetical protein
MYHLTPCGGHLAPAGGSRVGSDDVDILAVGALDVDNKTLCQEQQ